MRRWPLVVGMIAVLLFVLGWWWRSRLPVPTAAVVVPTTDEAATGPLPPAATPRPEPHEGPAHDAIATIRSSTGFAATLRCPLPPGPDDLSVSVLSGSSGVVFGAADVSERTFRVILVRPEGEARVRAEGYGAVALTFADAVDGGVLDCDPPEWRLREGGVAEGRVLGPDGEAVGSVVVQGCGGFSSSDDGSYYLELEPEEDEPCEVRPLVHELPVTWFGDWVDVDPDAEAVMDLPFVPTSADVHVGGTSELVVTIASDESGPYVVEGRRTRLLSDGTLSESVAAELEGQRITEIDGEWIGSDAGLAFVAEALSRPGVRWNGGP